MLSALDVQFLGQPQVIAACLLEGSHGGVALVDPGPTTSLPGLRAALAARGRDLADVEDILLTHIHLDHAGATGAIVREHPLIRVHVHERGAPHMIDPSRLLRSAARLYGADMQRLWGEVAPVPEVNVRVLVGGETIPAAGRPLRVAYTPGHASHHVSYFDPQTRTAFVGDTGGVRIGTWPVVLPPTPPPDIDLEAWEHSLRTILAWKPEALFVTHFGSFTDPAGHVAQLRRWLTDLRDLAESEGSAAVDMSLRAPVSSEYVLPRVDRPVSVDSRPSGHVGRRDIALEDEAKMRAFARQLEEMIASQAGADAVAAYARAVPFEHCWLGLARYLNRKS